MGPLSGYLRHHLHIVSIVVVLVYIPTNSELVCLSRPSHHPHQHLLFSDFCIIDILTMVK